MSECVTLFRAVFPTKKKQDDYHRELEQMTGMKVVRVSGRWMFVKPKVKQ